LAVGETSKPAPAKSGAPATSTAVAAATTSAAAGPFWVQVGAFKDAETARRLAGKLREDNFKVEETTTRVGGGASTTKGTTAKAGDAASDRYDVYVSGPSADEVNKRLADKGLTVESAAGVLIVKPSLPLRDAVALSKDLAAEGFKVQVKRAGGAAGTPATAAVANSSIELHRVRVGSFADRAAAQAAARDLEAKGYKPYIARGDR
jgi:cell division septation protein DedD